MFGAIVRRVRDALEAMALNRAIASLAALLLAVIAVAEPDYLLEVATATIALGVLYLAPVLLDHRNLTRELRDQTTALRAVFEDQATPAVLVTAELLRDGDQIFIVVEHIGSVPIRDVTVRFDPPLVNSKSENVGSVPPLSEAFALLRPGDRIETRFDSASAIRERHHLSGMRHELDNPAPDVMNLAFEATVRYFSVQSGGPARTMRFDLDLGPLLWERRNSSNPR